ncbi:MAG: DUF6122 family protein [Gammaproteobacteria bacterium]
MILHFLVPLPFAAGLYKKAWLKNYALMLAGLLIDIDHLLADPIYYAARCSIGFHPLHTPLPIILYVMLLAHPKTRALGIGLCLHILLDGADCLI